MMCNVVMVLFELAQIRGLEMHDVPPHSQS